MILCYNTVPTIQFLSSEVCRVRLYALCWDKLNRDLKHVNGARPITPLSNSIPKSPVSLRCQEIVPTHRGRTAQLIGFHICRKVSGRRGHECLFILLHPLFLPTSDSWSAQHMEPIPAGRARSRGGRSMIHSNPITARLIDSQILT